MPTAPRRLRSPTGRSTERERNLVSGMKDLWTALALVFVIEGILYALFPEAMKRMVAQMAALPPQVLRGAGLAASVLGVGAVWLVRH
jgi:uncharacterized protein